MQETKYPASGLRIAMDGRSLSSKVLRGWDRYTVGLVRTLVQNGVEVDLFRRADAALEQCHVDDLGCGVVPLRDLGGLYWEQIAVPLALKKGRYDLYHAPAEHGVPLLAPCPVVLTLHSATRHSYEDMIRTGRLDKSIEEYLGYDPKNVSRFAHWYLDRQWRTADHILTPSAFARDEVIQYLGISSDRVTATHLAVDPQFTRTSTPQYSSAVITALSLRSPYVLCVGGYERHKNVLGVLHTFGLALEKCPELNLVMVGSGSVPAFVQTEIAALGAKVASQITLLCNVREDLPAIYDHAELLLSLSWRETFCLPILEAFSRGIPVVASAWGASPEVAGHVGALVDPRDIYAARDTVVDMLRSNRKMELGPLMRAQAAKFTWKKTCFRTMEVYERVVRRPN